MLCLFFLVRHEFTLQTALRLWGVVLPIVSIFAGGDEDRIGVLGPHATDAKRRDLERLFLARPHLTDVTFPVRGQKNSGWRVGASRSKRPIESKEPSLHFEYAEIAD
jgi:hypothetical protein